MLLVPALGGAALLFRRFGWIAFVGTALLAFATVAGNRFGADGGGAIVLAGGFAVLAVLLSGGGRRALAIAVGVSFVLALGLVALDAATGGSSHVTKALDDGPVGLAEDLGERVELSWERATRDWYIALSVSPDAGGLRLPRRENPAPPGLARRLGRRARAGFGDRRLARRERLADRRPPRRADELCGRRRGYASRAMARYFALLVAVLALAVVAGCGGGEESSPAARDREGTLPTESGRRRRGRRRRRSRATPPPARRSSRRPAAAAATRFADAGTTGTVGPNLDDSTADFDAAVDAVTNGGGGDAGVQGQLSERADRQTSPPTSSETRG